LNLAVLVGTVGLCLGLGEIGARLAFKNTVLFPRYHSAVHYGAYTLRRIRPGTTFWHTSVDGSWQFRINRQGFRDDRDYAYAKAEGVVRILVLGDSHTQGFEVDQEATYAEVIERHLAGRGICAEVLNTGVSGMGTAEQLAFLESEGLRYAPDVVVLGFYANDFEDSVRSKLFALEGERFVSVSHSYAPATGALAAMNELPPLRWLAENSHLYSVAMNTAWDLARRITSAAAEDTVQTEYAVPTEALSGYKEQLIARLLARMHRLVSDRGSRLIIADIPAPHSWATGVALTESGQRSAEPVSSVPADLRPIFRASSDRFLASEDYIDEYWDILPLHRPNGHRHISEFTHALLGVAIAREIQGMLDPGGRRPEGCKEAAREDLMAHR
jgi:lysophospholipase L1-like esterase